jgi:hypothetical protein
LYVSFTTRLLLRRSQYAYKYYLINLHLKHIDWPFYNRRVGFVVLGGKTMESRPAPDTESSGRRNFATIDPYEIYERLDQKFGGATPTSISDNHQTRAVAVPKTAEQARHPKESSDQVVPEVPTKPLKIPFSGSYTILNGEVVGYQITDTAAMHRAVEKGLTSGKLGSEVLRSEVKTPPPRTKLARAMRPPPHRKTMPSGRKKSITRPETDRKTPQAATRRASSHTQVPGASLATRHPGHDRTGNTFKPSGPLVPERTKKLVYAGSGLLAIAATSIYLVAIAEGHATSPADTITPPVSNSQTVPPHHTQPPRRTRTQAPPHHQANPSPQPSTPPESVTYTGQANWGDMEFYFGGHNQDQQWAADFDGNGTFNVYPPLDMPNPYNYTRMHVDTPTVIDGETITLTDKESTGQDNVEWVKMTITKS